MSSKEELRTEFIERYKNTTKEYERKLQRFDILYERASRIAEYLFGGETNKSKEQIQADLMREFYAYKGSILKSFRNLKTRTFEENVERAKQLRVKHRLKEFLNKWGTEEFSYNGETKSIERWVKDFLENKISSEKLFEIIKAYQNQNPEYDVSQYRKSDSAQSILNDKFA